jgi:anion-transporting  ArsA/GET3 family ATPase
MAKRKLKYDKATQTISGVPIRDDEKVKAYLQAELDNRMKAAGMQTVPVEQFAPTPQSRRRYVLKMLRNKMAPTGMPKQATQTLAGFDKVIKDL